MLAMVHRMKKKKRKKRRRQRMMDKKLNEEFELDK